MISIDSLQRSDASSIAWILRLLRRGDAPPLLLIASHRSDDVAGRATLQPLYDGLGVGSRIDVRRLTLGSPRTGVSVLETAAIHV